MITPVRAPAPVHSPRFAPVERARAARGDRNRDRAEGRARPAGSPVPAAAPLLAGLVPNVAPRGEIADLAARRAWLCAYRPPVDERDGTGRRLDVRA